VLLPTKNVSRVMPEKMHQRCIVGTVWAYHAIDLTADIDWMTADTNRVTADQAELR